MTIDEFKIHSDIDKVTDKIMKRKRDINPDNFQDFINEIQADLIDIKIEICKHNSKYFK